MQRYIDAEKVKVHFLTAYPLLQSERLMNTIDGVPTADVQEVKHGKWTIVEKNGDIWCDSKCSCCGLIQRFYNGFYGSFKYCPYCGARMDGDEK